MHCTAPGLERERINITFRLDQTTCSILFTVEARCGVLFANVCEGFIRSWYTVVKGNCPFWEVWVLLVVLLKAGMPVLLVYLVCSLGPGMHWRALQRTRPLGGGRRGLCPRNLREVHQILPQRLVDSNKGIDTCVRSLGLFHVVASARLPLFMVILRIL